MLSCATLLRGLLARTRAALITCVIVGFVAAGIEIEVADARGAGGLEVDDVQEGVAGDGLPGTVAVAHAEEGARRVELYFPYVL